MAGSKRPRSVCAHTNSVNVQDGTLCRAESPKPGSLSAELYSYSVSLSKFMGSEYEVAAAKIESSYRGVQRGLRSDYEGAQCLVRAYRRAEGLATGAIYKETGYQLGALLSGLLPGLLQMIKVLSA